MRATTGAAPVPVPPPSPAVTKTMSLPRSAERTWSYPSSAAWRPVSGSAPEPSPWVIDSPMWIFTGASEISSCCASVLTATKSTCAMPASIIRFTALIPAPPTPTTRITARYDATSPATWSRGALSGIGVTNRLAGGVYGSDRRLGHGRDDGGSAGASRAAGTSTTSATGSTARGAAAGISTTGASGSAAASAAFSAARSRPISKS